MCGWYGTHHDVSGRALAGVERNSACLRRVIRIWIEGQRIGNIKLSGFGMRARGVAVEELHWLRAIRTLRRILRIPGAGRNCNIIGARLQVREGVIALVVCAYVGGCYGA